MNTETAPTNEANKIATHDLKYEQIKWNSIPVLLQEKVAINRSVSFNLQQDVTGKVLPIY